MIKASKKYFKVIDLIDKINSGEFVLPEIQREFVWDLSKIADLWDSIYRGYPIGQLLFWDTETEVPVYSFLDDSENTPFLFIGGRPKWLHARKIEKTANKTMILDGQQRLTALFLGASINGVTVKTRINSAPDKRYLCIYTGDEDENDDNDIKLFDWKREEESRDYISVAKALMSRRQDKHIHILKERLNSIENSIPVSRVDSDSVVDVVEIFHRLNNNGKNMSNSELFLATWFGNMSAKNLRKELLTIHNAFGKDFDVKDTTITQLLITIFGKPGEERLGAKAFPPEIFKTISKGIPLLKRSIRKTISFLHDDCGIYSNGEMVSHNLFIPIVHTFYHFKCNVPKNILNELRCFTYRALVFGLFSRRTTQVLADLKKSVDELNPGDGFISSMSDSVKSHCFGDLSKTQWLDGEIDELIKQKKGSKTNLILLLLYKGPANVRGKLYEQDHLVARDLFDETTHKALNQDRHQKFGIRKNDKIIKENQLSDEELKAWEKISKDKYSLRDTLPNLWLLESSRNKQKGKKLLNLWYKEQSESAQSAFWQSILLRKQDVDYLKLSNFEKFYDNRRDCLYKAIKELLKLPKKSA